MKSYGSQLLLRSTKVLYGPVWYTMVPYKHLGSPQSTLFSKKGKIRIQKNEEKTKMEK